MRRSLPHTHAAGHFCRITTLTEVTCVWCCTVVRYSTVREAHKNRQIFCKITVRLQYYASRWLARSSLAVKNRFAVDDLGWHMCWCITFVKVRIGRAVWYLDTPP